ncbi:MAG: hypothetical protein AB7F86_18285 [Bdellovibrionales bacterium]
MSARKLAPTVAEQIDLKVNRAYVATPSSIGVTENEQPSDLLRFALDQGFNHICQRDGFDCAREIASAESMIADPESFFKHPVSTIISPSSAGASRDGEIIKVQKEFHSSAQKRELLEEFENYLTGCGLSQTLTGDVTAVADEFITNALYNAPFIDPATSHNPGLNRLDTEINLEKGKFGRITLGHDENLLVVACEDPYGSLNLTHYLTKIQKTYLSGPGSTMNFGRGGAALGSYIIFNAGSSLHFGVKSARVTMLSCALPLKMSYKKRVQLPKHLHLIRL